MGRQLKQGLDYLTLDVDFFESVKVRKIKKDCGNQSIPILIALLCNIFREEGYYVKYDNDLAFLIAEQFGVSEGAVEDTVRKAVSVEFFDSHMFQKYGILTSHGIQQRYFDAVARLKRKSVKVTGDFLCKNISPGINTDFLRDKSNNLWNKSDKVEEEVEVEEEEEEEVEDKASSPKTEIIKAFSSSSPGLEKSIKKWMDMRKQRKASVSPTALKKNLTQLKKLSNGNIEDAVLIVEQSIENQWLGFWPLKKHKRKKSEGSYGHIASLEEWKGIKDGW